MLLQTLHTRDFGELAAAFPRWDLRFRQFGRGSFGVNSSFSSLKAQTQDNRGAFRFQCG